MKTSIMHVNRGPMGTEKELIYEEIMDKTFLKPIEETNPQIQRSTRIPGRIRKKKNQNTQLKTKDKRWAQSKSKKICIRFQGTTVKLRSDLWKLGWIQKIMQGHPVSKTHSLSPNMNHGEFQTDSRKVKQGTIWKRFSMYSKQDLMDYILEEKQIFK